MNRFLYIIDRMVYSVSCVAFGATEHAFAKNFLKGAPNKNNKKRLALKYCVLKKQLNIDFIIEKRLFLGVFLCKCSQELELSKPLSSTNE